MIDQYYNDLFVCYFFRIKKLKNSTGLLIVNVCVCEILSTVFKMTPTTILLIVASIRRTVPYVNPTLSFTLCTFLASFMEMFCHDLAIISLTLIAIDRFLAVKYPLKRYIDRNRAKKLIVVTWLASFIIASPYLYSKRYTERSDGSLFCVEEWDPLPSNSDKMYILFHVVMFLIVPLCVIGTLYSITMYKVWVRRIPGNVTAANQQLEYKTKVNVVKMCLTVVVMFAVCWTPLFAITIIDKFKLSSCIPHHVRVGVTTLSFTFHVINPAIYFAFSQDYRKGFWKIMKCCK